MSDVSVTPSALDQIQTSITEWLGKVGVRTRLPVRFTRASGGILRLLVAPKSKANLKLEMKEQQVRIRASDRSLTVNLENFLVTTAILNEQLCIDIKTPPKPAHRSLDSALREVAGTKHPVFVSRMLRVVTDLTGELTNTRIDEASAAKTDFEALLDALSASVEMAKYASANPLIAGKLRGLRRKQEILERAGGTFTSEEMAEAIGISRQAVDKRRSANQLLAVTQGKRGYAYPRFQLEDGKTLSGLEDVLERLKTLDPWMQLIFFATPNEHLEGMTPIETLRQGKPEMVKEAARGYGEQGAV
jgi:hypothetical protein